jgi:hypothetical protein
MLHQSDDSGLHQHGPGILYLSRWKGGNALPPMNIEAIAGLKTKFPHTYQVGIFQLLVARPCLSRILLMN